MFNDLLKLNKALKMADRPYYVGLVVVDRDRGKVLLGKRREDGKWTGPGGAADPGEHPKQAAIREAFEEANLHIRARDLKELPTIVCGDGKVCHVFLAYVDSKTAKVHGSNDPDKEVRNWEWHDIHGALPGKMDHNRLVSLNNAKMKVLGLKKSILENPDAGIDLNTAENSLDVLSTKSDAWVQVIKDTMLGAEFGATPHELMLPKHLKLYISKVDDGIYSAILKREDPSAGDYGEVQTQLMKMTPEAMVAALKAKGYLPSNEAVVEAPAKDYAGLLEGLEGFQGQIHIHLAKSDALEGLLMALAPPSEHLTTEADLKKALDGLL